MYRLLYDENGSGAKKLMRLNDDREVSLPAAKRRAVIPWNNRILIHNDGYGQLLLVADDRGRAYSLLPPLTCYSSMTSVTVWDHYAFFSIKRFEIEGALYALERYKNDPVEGTYRMDLNTGSFEKISDGIYSALFNFNDTCLYASNSRGVYQLDFDGNVTQTVYELRNSILLSQ